MTTTSVKISELTGPALRYADIPSELMEEA